ncbi:3-isopropylmalate dehydratase large subunit (plasmid) [Burkholderia glumae]|uniref:3-isopropylmalate dehydratase large subunit n=1 Tax=Burkholderia glumae TaxID=337 RepID=A0ABY5BB60_BURGL|nr:3-isopropylmalate dehydratase large subunit [Burkholderia glumae]USS44236.1 3-isopropylmalate dehydratase large subunit [Burkholderia glumae]
MARTLYDKIFDAHIVRTDSDGNSLLYVDRHLFNEVTSPQAFEGLRHSHRVVWRPKATLAVADHNVPTTDRSQEITDETSRVQVKALRDNCEANGVRHFGMSDPHQGIVHVVGPEIGATLPGMTVVCGDSHTSTHGALGALAFGIGTSEIEHVLATQTLATRRSKNMRVSFTGTLPTGCSAKDVALSLIGKIGTAGATGYAIEFAGPVVDALSMEARMTLCNMSIEAGARVGLIAVDEKTLDFCRARKFAPKGDEWQRASEEWRQLFSDSDAVFDAEVVFDVSSLTPQVTWGTSPEMVAGILDVVPDPATVEDRSRRKAYELALSYMDLVPGTPLREIPIDKVFIGSCTNGRIEDLRAAASVLKRLGGRIAPSIRLAIAVPGSTAVKRQAEAEGLHSVFLGSGFEWREAGCSMCLGMNPDHLEAGERVASTSNRNFEGRQGAGGRSHLVSPEMAAAAAIAGHFVDIRDYKSSRRH